MLIRYCISNGAYIGCDPPDVGLPLHQQTSGDVSESTANCAVESINPISSQDLPSCTNVPVCDGNDSVMESMQTDILSHSQQSDSGPSNNGSTVTVSGNHLSDTVTDAAACYSVETVDNVVEDHDLSQTCQSVVSRTVIADSSEFDSVPPSVGLPSTAELDSLTDIGMQECTPVTSAIEQLHCDADAAENQDANHTCHLVVDNTVAEDRYEFDSIPPPVTTVSANLSATADVHSLTDIDVQTCAPESDALEQLQCEADAVQNQDVSQTCQLLSVASTVVAESCEFDPVLPPVSMVPANLPPADDVHSLRDGCIQESRPDTEAVERCEADAAESIAAHPDVEVPAAQSVELSHDFCDNRGNDTEPSVTTHSVDSGAIDSEAEITTAETSDGNYPSDLSRMPYSVDPQILSVMTSVEKSLAERCESGLNGKAAGGCQSDSVYSPDNRQSSSDQVSAPTVSSDSWTLQHSSYITHGTHSHVGNSAVGYRASAVAAENTIDINPSLNGNAETNYKAQSPVLTVQSAAATGKRLTAMPTRIGLQQKIIRQMEVCIQLAVFCYYFEKKYLYE